MPPGTDAPADVAQLFAVERSHLLALLEAIEAPDWERPSPCPGWTVLDLVCHLLGDDFSLLSRHGDDHRGTAPPERLSEAGFITWLDELQAEWVRAARRMSPRLATALLAWTGPQLVDVLANQDPHERSAQVSWAGAGTVPVWLDQVRELSEFWIHRQQLLLALGRPSELDPKLLGPILEGLRWAYPFRLAEARGELGDTVVIEIAGTVAVTWYLVTMADGWDFQPMAGTRLVARLAMTTDQAWRLLTNNLSRDQHAQLQLSGDDTITGIIRQTRAIIGTPK